MRMERINSNQIRIVISNQDLAEWKLTIREMKYGSKETTELFRQMISKAVQQYSFNQDGLPLMIEAVPVSQEELLLIISAVEDAEELDPHFASFAPPSPALPGFPETETTNAYEPGKGGNSVKALVLTFADIDSVMEFSWSIGTGFMGHTALYRVPKSTAFYLVMEKPEGMENDTFMHFMNGLPEYADVIPQSGPLYGYLLEHEKPLMDDPLRKFAGY